MTKLLDEIKLFGLIMPYEEEICSYFTELPQYFTLCNDFRDLYRLKKGKRRDSKENLEINTGMDILIHDPYAKKYFYRTLKSYTNMARLFRYYNDFNLYILKEEHRIIEELQEEEKPDVIITDDKTQLLF